MPDGDEPEALYAIVMDIQTLIKETIKQIQKAFSCEDSDIAVSSAIDFGFTSDKLDGLMTPQELAHIRSAQKSR